MKGNRRLLVVSIALLLVAACSGGSDDTGGTTTSTAAGTATTTAGETTTTSTMPSAADVAATVLAYVLAECDWPEAYPEGSDPVVATWEDIDGATGDLTARRDGWSLPAWEVPVDSAELTAAGLYGFAHRIVDLPGTTLVSGAYLFESADAALAAFDTVTAAFGDGPGISAATGLGYDLTEVTRLQDDPNATSAIFQIESSQEAWRPRTIRAAVFLLDDLVVTVRAAYPMADDARFRAYADTEFAVVSRLVGSPAGFPTAPLATAAPEVGMAVAMAGDPWLGGGITVSGAPETWPDGLQWTAPDTSGLSEAEKPVAGAPGLEYASFRFVDLILSELDGLGPVYTGMLRFADSGSAAAGFQAIAAVYADTEQMSLLTLPQPLDTITEVDAPGLGDEAYAAVARFGDGTETDRLQVVGVVWRTGPDVQWIRVRTTNPAAADVLEATLGLAAVLAERLPAPTPTAAPALNEGCGAVEGSGDAVLDASPWLTEAAVLQDGDGWVGAPGGDVFILSREEAEGLTDDGWAAARAEVAALGATVSQAEVPVDLEFFTVENRPARASAVRVAVGDEATLWTGAILYEDTTYDDPNTTDVEQFIVSGMGWANLASPYEYPGSIGWLFSVGGDAPLTFDTLTLLPVPNLGEQIYGAVITGAGTDQQVAGIVWRDGALVQWVRARMPAGDDATLQSMIDVAAAMAARGG